MGHKDITTDQLITLNLKYSSEGRSLRLDAYMQTVMKVLHKTSKGYTKDELPQILAKHMDVKNIDKGVIINALECLAREGFVNKLRGRYSLVDEIKPDIEESINSFSSDLERVLGTYFDVELSEKKLRHWFLTAIADFFGYFSEEWISTISRNIKRTLPKNRNIRMLLKSSIEEYNLGQNKEKLEEGFYSFISTEEPRDIAFIMSLASAVLASRLLAADMGSDPVCIEDFKNAHFILDTNILFALRLESKLSRDALITLADSLEDLGCELIFLHASKEEYKRVVHDRKGRILVQLNRFGSDVIKEADDYFVQSALREGASDEKSISEFFDSIQDPPSLVGSKLELEEFDDAEVLKIEDQSQNDAELKKVIQKIYFEIRPESEEGRRENALNHDACLINSLSYVRKDKPAFIISLDRVLQYYGLKTTSRKEIPSVISLDALIHLLSVNNSGTLVDASRFAPLFKNLVLSKCTPMDGTYTITDLQWLYSLQQGVASFPSGYVKEIASVIRRERSKGRTQDDPSLIRMVDRLYRKAKTDVGVKLENSVKATEEAKKSVRDERKNRKLVEEELLSREIKSLRVRKIFRFIVGLIIRIIVVAALVFIIYLISKRYISGSDGIGVIVDVGVVILTGVLSRGFFKRFWIGIKEPIIRRDAIEKIRDKNPNLMKPD